MSQPDRRRSIRLPVNRPVKLRCDTTGPRYLAGRTRNLSAGGVLVEVDAGDERAALRVGESVKLALGTGDTPVLVRSADLIDATVVRREATGASMAVALRFDAVGE